MKSSLNLLEKDKTSLKKYDEIIKKQLEDGITEKADGSKEYLDQDFVVTHYLPHHLVKSKNSTLNKVRVVYEGCSKTHPTKKSLNECLHRGKNIVADLYGILLRFRMKKYGIVADIKKAYLQLELNPEDRDVTRFLWLKDINQSYSRDNVQAYRFCRVIWGVICSAFLLASTILFHVGTYYSPNAEDISRNIYVDNLISGSTSHKDSVIYYEKTVIDDELTKAAELQMDAAEVCGTIK